MQTQDELVESCLPMVRFFARQYATMKGGMPMEDLVGEGCVGLMQAGRSFDPARGIKFATFAAPRIRGAILDALRRANPIGRSSAHNVSTYLNAIDHMRSEFGREPDDNEVAFRLKVTMSNLQATKTMRALHISSIDECEETHGEQFVANETSVEDEVVGKMLSAELRILMPRLMPRDREIIQRTFWQNETLSSIGADLGITESRVSQIRTRALKRLRSMMEAENLRAAA